MLAHLMHAGRDNAGGMIDSVCHRRARLPLSLSTGIAEDCLIYLSAMSADDPMVGETARAMAEETLSGLAEFGPHEHMSATGLLTALLLHVALHPDEDGRRTLERLQEFANAEWSRDDAAIAFLIEAGNQHKVLYGVVHGEFITHMARPPREQAAINDMVRRALAAAR